MVAEVRTRGYFSILRWRTDATRDEARNVAVLLVDAEGQFGGIQSAPPSAMSPNLREQGLLDSIIHGLVEQFDQDAKPDLARLREIHKSLKHSLYVTEPKPTAVLDVDATLRALYKAYVAPRATPRSLTKGVVLDKVVASLRKRGYVVRRSEYIGDFIFDALAEHAGQQVAFDVLSFATPHKDWISSERDAGHFLYALEKVRLPGRAVVQPPTEASQESATATLERIGRWFEDAGVPVMHPDEVIDQQKLLSLGV